jgi:hypothetical protein
MAVKEKIPSIRLQSTHEVLAEKKRLGVSWKLVIRTGLDTLKKQLWVK